MTLEARIEKCLVQYYQGKEQRLAYRLSKLYLVLAQRSIPDQERVLSAGYECLYWLKIAGYVPGVVLADCRPDEIKYLLRQFIKCAAGRKIGA